MKPAYKRILLKLSGEALAGSKGTGLDNQTLHRLGETISKVVALGVEVALVVGSGNFWRGRTSAGMDRVTADHMGMLATAMNALALSDALEQAGVVTRVQSAIEMRQIAEPYIRKRAIRHLEKGRVVIFACGTGNPFFTTDTAAALRAMEVGAQVLLKATKVDGVYDRDPLKNPDAKRFDHLSFIEALNLGVEVMDATALSLCKENNLPLIVFKFAPPDSIVRVVCGEPIGTLVTNGS